MSLDALPSHFSITAQSNRQGATAAEFPDSHHLVIATEKAVLCLDRDGLVSIFTSSSSGILAAKEAKDGRGTLAIADSQVVVLHNVEKGDKSYRLKGTDGQIRLLEYSPDGSNLFFTTTLLNAVQMYSLTEQRLLSPGPCHPSPPTVIAISPSSHLLLSCSEAPPIIYLQALVLGTQPTRFQPWVSNAPVMRAAFHKSRPNMFALAFKDGTVAAYDYNKISRAQPALSVERMRTDIRQPGEIGHFKQHHVVTTTGLVDPDGYISTASLGGYDDATKTVAAGARSIGITGIGFIPGFRARCVSVGADGKCKIVDFELLYMVKEWHIKAPATCLNVLSLKTVEEDGGEPVEKRRTVSQVSIKAPTGNQKGGPDVCQIAIGRVDGKVLIYDMVGNLLREVAADISGGRVIDVDWIRGPKPRALGESRRIDLMDNAGCIELRDSKRRNPSMHKKGRRVGFEKAMGHRRNNSELTVIPSKSDKATASSTVSAPSSPMMKATIDNVHEIPEAGGLSAEDMYSTVKHHTIKGPMERELPISSTTGYMDLFSPIKPGSEAVPVIPIRESPKRKPSTRPRPRVTSSTYKSPVGTPQNTLKEPGSANKTENVGPQDIRNGGIPGSKGFESEPQRHGGIHRSSTHETYKRTPGAYITSSSTRLSTSSSASSANSKILSDIKRFAETGAFDNGPRPGSLAVFAPYMQQKKKRIGDDRKYRRRSSAATIKTKTDRRRSSMLGEARQAVIETPADHQQDGDIWFSSESGSESKPTSEETRRGRRSKQNVQPSQRRRSRGVSGRPRHAYGAKGSSENESTSITTEKISSIQQGRSQSSHHAHPPASICKDSLSSSLEPMKSASSSQEYSNTTESPSTNAKTSLASPSISSADFGHLSIYAPSAALPSHTNATASLPATSGTATSTQASAATEFEDTLTPLSSSGVSRLGSAPAPQLPLPPGYAASFAGPVDVEMYLPRKGSLAAGEQGRSPSPGKRRRVRTDERARVPRSPFECARERRALGDVSGNEVGSPRAKGKEGGAVERVDSVVPLQDAAKGQCCGHCEELQSEMARLREELASLRRLVKGKGKAASNSRS